MSRELRCPNCGGEHTLVNPGITMLVCDFCQTVVYWDEDTALKQGSRSVLPEGDTRLFMHAHGTLGGRGFEVVGHLRYDHRAGTWDEWYLQLDDGSVAWLSEDERELTLEQAVRPDGPIPGPGALQLGAAISLEGVSYTVRELGNATCVGGEGQLPFTILPGEQYPYADLASLDGARFATLEYDEGEQPTCFVGVLPQHGELTVEGEAPPSTAGGHEGRNIRCPNCDAPLEVTGEREVETLVCDYCGAQNDLTGAEARVVGINPEGYDPGFYFEVGQPATIDDARYEVCGRMLYSDDEGYQAREYLLHNPERGYLWLAEENGHFVLNSPTQMAPARSPFAMVPKERVDVGGHSFQFYEQGTSQLVYVDGALPWQAATGDTNRYADLVAPPQMFGVERSAGEVEYFIGQYVPPADIWQAFQQEGPPPPAYGVHPAQPFQRGTTAKMLMTLGALFALVNAVLLFWSLGQGGEQVFRQRFASQDYLKETMSRPFTVGKGAVMAMEIDAPLNDSWIALQVALVDSQDRVVEELEGEISYYSGVEGGERWSEGSRSSVNYGKAPPPGTYRLLLKASGGTGNVGGPRGERLTVTLRQGGVLSRYFLALMLIAGIFPLFEVLRRRLFEQRRWGPVIEDDDDDD